MFCPYFQDVLELLKNDSIFYLDGSRRYDKIKFKGKTDEIVSILIINTIFEKTKKWVENH